MRVWFEGRPAACEVRGRADGLADVYLRKGIALVGEGEEAHWEADEVHVCGRYTQGEAEESFDALWTASQRSEMGTAQRFGEVEADVLGLAETIATAQADADAAICELYEMLIGEE